MCMLFQIFISCCCKISPAFNAGEIEVYDLYYGVAVFGETRTLNSLFCWLP